MSRNLYLGADLGPALAAGNTCELFWAADDITKVVDATNFPFRARRLAREIRRSRPDLVGLQEVALFRTQRPPDGPATPAQTVRYDFLALLMRELNRGKRTYRVANQQPLFDIEVPADAPPRNCPPSLGPEDYDTRLTMRDVILARRGAGVQTKNRNRSPFQNVVELPIAAPPPLPPTVEVTRGWLSVNAKVRNSKWFRFVNTHLEAFDAGGQIRRAQALELLQPSAAKPRNHRRLPVILVGDLNSDSRSATAGQRLAYDALIQRGFRMRDSRHFSCCYQGELLNNPADTFTHKVDHVLTNAPARIKKRRARVTGTVFDTLWASDHGGVWSALRVPRAGR